MSTPEQSDVCRQPTAAMRAGRRTLEEIDGCRLVEDYRWYEAEFCWALVLELDVHDPSRTSPQMPRTSRWYVLVEHDYPRGRISVHPAAVGGVTLTFPHQDRNGPAAEGRPWRGGRLCLDLPSAALERLHPPAEPSDAVGRLAWHIRRALEWIAAAQGGVLQRRGDPFELPDFEPESKNAHLVYSEDTARGAPWSAVSKGAGTVILHAMTLHERRLSIAGDFLDGDGRVVASTGWGEGIRLQQATRARGGWVLLPAAPIVAPWQAPRTWGELRACARTMEVELDALVEDALKPLAGTAAPVLLVGFPVPAHLGGEDVEVHWRPLRMPPVPAQPRRQRDARPRAGGRGERAPILASMGLSDDLPLRWGQSENWSPASLGARGRLRSPLRERPVAILGVGALGSAAAEILVRGGVKSLTLVDGERLAAGNLVRHTLGIADIGDMKASAVARRLVGIHPHVEVKSFDGTVPADAKSITDLLGEVDVVLDCTADDDVLYRLARIESGRDRRWISLSLGFEGRRLYIFEASGPRFPADHFHQTIEPWVRREGLELRERELPRAGPGCWHPLFPARHDAVMLMAALAVNELDARGGEQVEGGSLRVIQAVFDEAGRLVRIAPEQGDDLASITP